MAIKKKGKGRFASKKTVVKKTVVNRIVNKPLANEGFFQRMKEIIKSEMPQPEKVRVKTFIVEKPVIIHDRTQRADSDDVFESKNSRYSRNSIATGMGLVKKKKPVEDEFDENASDADEQFPDDSSEDDLSAGSEEDLAGEEGSDDSLGDDADLVEGEGAGSEVPLDQPTHTRSRGMFNNIWWKKALFWSILVWLLILAVTMAMQALKLLVVDLSRQWWMLLGIIIVIAMVYFKFFDGKINI
jgi:hypothetical protein